MPTLEKFLLDEQNKGLNTKKHYDEFKNKVFEFKIKIREF
jgi:hypothetical protein